MRDFSYISLLTVLSRKYDTMAFMSGRYLGVKNAIKIHVRECKRRLSNQICVWFLDKCHLVLIFLHQKKLWWFLSDWEGRRRACGWQTSRNSLAACLSQLTAAFGSMAINAVWPALPTMGKYFLRIDICLGFNHTLLFF